MKTTKSTKAAFYFIMILTALSLYAAPILITAPLN
jgi:hypothetical protein